MDPFPLNRMAWRRAAAAALVVTGCAGALAAADPPAPARQAQLAHWLRDDCGACHGMTLRGGLGPPLTPASLAGKPPDGLVATVLYGRPGTAMPPWLPFMTQDEARWLIDRLQAGQPPAVTPQDN
ncbi:c-type cytochrome [Cupriavidus taiwanensis]|uniref:c-type cytochrome n=1 Tax=Cupriavidus taiwanensis TaxID=164546 RepID=UPI000E15B80F|nr:cytochrome c [Cupriavidus taiwanensis]SOY93088.1 C-type cytochrome c55X precursor [Cupriavidus taiwanensis]